MNAQDYPRFCSIVYGLAEVYGREISENGVKLWWGVLSPYQADDVARAARDLMLTSPKMPLPADVVKAIAGDPEQKAEVEASKVLDAIKRVGPYRSVAFDDETTTAVVLRSFGSWEETIQAAEEQSEHWFIKDFTRRWKAFYGQGIRKAGKCPGCVERLNSANGHGDREEQLALIGDKVKAKQVAITAGRENGDGPRYTMALLSELTNDKNNMEALD